MCTTYKDLECVSKVQIDNNKCMAPCSGLILTSFGKSKGSHNLESLLPEDIFKYNQYKKWTPYPDILGEGHVAVAGASTSKHLIRIYNYIFVLLIIDNSFRIWMEKSAKICKDLLWHPNIWQSEKGQSSKIYWHVVSNWRHHGTSHWILHHQRSGDSLLCS